MRTKTSLAVLLVLSALVSCSGGGGTESESSSGTTTVRVAVSPAAGTSAPLFHAVESGTYSDLGLDVQLDTATETNVVVPQLMNGQLDFAMASFESFINAAAEGLPIQMIAPANILRGGDSRFAAVIVDAGSNATDLSDTDVFAVQDAARGPQMELEVTALNGDYDEMEMLQVPLGSLAEAVASGAADAGHLFEPFLGQALDSGDVEVLSYITDEMTRPGAPGAILIANADALEDRPEVARSFVEGTMEAFRYADENRDEISAYTVETGLTDNPVAPENLPLYPVEPMPGSVVQDFIDFYTEYGYIPESPPLAEAVWLDSGAFS
ncbi:ABC transporter substrate-binding protein [Streptomyces sp. NPDC093252]|uniref:ABC transporter substrate-binding protein n=1 Tax=Streptomyces sp. NPDC093252 TaxID=3154980 RepID=UPI003424302C